MGTQPRCISARKRRPVSTDSTPSGSALLGNALLPSQALKDAPTGLPLAVLIPFRHLADLPRTTFDPRDLQLRENTE